MSTTCGWSKISARPNRIALFTETIRALRSLLRGDPVKLRGRAVHLDGVRLAHPPTVPPPVVSGVPGAQSTELTILRNNTMHYLSGQVADGTIISEGHGPAAIASALYYIEAGREAFETTWPHEVIVFALHHVNDDPDQVHAATTEAVEERARNLGVGIEDVFLAAGTATTTAERVHSLWDAGAETVVLRPIGADPLNQLRATADRRPARAIAGTPTATTWALGLRPRIAARSARLPVR